MSSFEGGRGGYVKDVSSQGQSPRDRSPFDGRIAQRTISGRRNGASHWEDVPREREEVQIPSPQTSLNRSNKVGALPSPREQQKWEVQNGCRNVSERGMSFKSRDDDAYSSRRSFTNGKPGRHEVQMHLGQAKKYPGEGRDVGGSSFKSRDGDDLRRFSASERAAREDAQGHLANRHDVRGSAFTSATVQKQRVQADEREERIETLSKKREEFVDGLIPSPSRSSKGSSFSRKNSFERDDQKKREELGQLAILRPSSSEVGSFSRKNSFDRNRREGAAELPIFSPRVLESEREGSFGKMARQRSSVSKALKNSALDDGDESWKATKPLPSKGWESASAGMHRTRSTDWYEICLKEEAEELKERMKALEEKEALGNAPMAAKVTDFRRMSSFDRKLEDPVDFSPSSSSKGETRRGIHFERERLLHDSLARENVVDRAKQKFRIAERSGDPGVSEGLLFTPWNSLRSGSSTKVNHDPVRVRQRSLAQNLGRSSGEFRDEVGGQEKLRVSTTGFARGGRGMAGRREISGVGYEESRLLEMRASRESLEDAVRFEGQVESVAGGRWRRGSDVVDDEGAKRPERNWDYEVRIREFGGFIAGGRGGSRRREGENSWPGANEQGGVNPEAGGRQAGHGGPGRRAVNAVDNVVAEKWRSRKNKEGAVRPEGLREFTTGGRPGSGRRQVNPISSEEPESWGSEKSPERLPAVGLSSIVAPDLVSNQAGSYRAIRPAALYHVFDEGEEELLPHIVGTCRDMCPVKERLRRERLRDLAVFERVSGDMTKTSAQLAVKKFCRTIMASDLEQSDVRSLPVLWRTLQYLLGLLDDPEFTFDIVHNFLFDRTRAIRQELGMQRILDHQSVTIHEEIVRFHILSEHELRVLNTKRSKQIDTHLNIEQLSKSLYSLLNLYISLGGDSGAQFENEAEFHSYYVLLNLGNHGRFQAEPLSLWLRNVPPHVLQGAPMTFARKALRFYRNSNFVGFFRLVREATYLQSCLLELNFDHVRAMALEVLNVAQYKLHPVPFSDLAQVLMLTEDKVDELCMYYGLVTGIDNSTQRRCLLAKQAQFARPEKGAPPQHICPFLDSKRLPSSFLEVKGGTLPT